jgi:lipopolysaccharide biosynthesis protein
MECRKKPIALDRELALFVSHSPNGKLKPHVRHYLECLAREHVGIILVIAADAGFAGDESWLYDLVDGLYVRANEGWDWACWAHVLRLNRDLYRADILYWLNDSVIGPVNQEAFHVVLERLRTNPAALVGLTANYQFGWHLQSYFLAFKRQALESLAFKEFVLGVRCLPSRERVIHGYEIPFARKLKEAKVTAAALFAPNQTDNPTVHNWKQLLDEGFPFLKQVVAMCSDNTVVDNGGWRAALQQHGYDVALADWLRSWPSSPGAQLSSCERP